MALAASLSLSSVASAAPAVISQAEGRLISEKIFGSNWIDQIAALAGARAKVTDPSQGDVIANVPLNVEAVGGLINLPIPGGINLFKENGIIALGAMGQYAAAHPDGSAEAFSGLVTKAESLAGIGTVSPGAVIGDSKGNSAYVRLSTAQLLGGVDLVNVHVWVGALAASAKQLPVTAEGCGAQSGDYLFTDFGAEVGGTIVGAIAQALERPIGMLLNLVPELNLPNPFKGGKISITQQDIEKVIGTDLNNLPPSTNLLKYLPQTIVNKVTSIVNGLIEKVSGALGPFGGKALDLVRAPLNTVLGTLTSALLNPLLEAVDKLAQVDVNVQEKGADGSFTQTALRVNAGPRDKSIAQVNLAMARVGPGTCNIDAIPLATGATAAITLGALLLGGMAYLAARPRVTGRRARA